MEFIQLINSNMLITKQLSTDILFNSWKANLQAVFQNPPLHHSGIHIEKVICSDEAAKKDSKANGNQ